MKPSSLRISSADFARICGTTKRTLIHYENIGLFLPSQRDENGYRYYSEAQHNMFLTIAQLKETGMSLEEIRDYLNSRNPERFKALLMQQIAQVNARIDRLVQISDMLHTKLKLLDESERMPQGRVLYQEEPLEYLIVSDPINSEYHDDKFSALYKHLLECNRLGIYSGYPYGAIVPKESVIQRQYAYYSYHFTKVATRLPLNNLFIKPAGFYATYYLKGDYRDVDYIYDEMLQSIEQNDYIVCGDSYREGLLEEMVEKQVEDYVIKISIQVKSKA